MSTRDSQPCATRARRFARLAVVVALAVVGSRRGSAEWQPPPRTGKDVGGKAKRARERSQADEEQRGASSAQRLASGEPTTKPSKVEAPEASNQGFLDRKHPYVTEDKWKKLDRAGPNAVVNEWKRKDATGYAARDAEYLRWAEERGPQPRDASENASAANATPLGPVRSAEENEWHSPRGDAASDKQTLASGAAAQAVEENTEGSRPA